VDSEDNLREDDSGRLSQLERLMIIPRMEPMTVPNFLLLFFACGIFPAAFILAYSAMGYGEYLAVWSRQYREYNGLLVGVLLGIATSLYLFDAHQWTSCVGRSVFCICLCYLFVGVAFWAQVNGNVIPHFSYAFSAYTFRSGCVWLSIYFPPRKPRTISLSGSAGRSSPSPCLYLSYGYGGRN